jgi:hypothetical protein
MEPRPNAAGAHRRSPWTPLVRRQAMYYRHEIQLSKGMRVAIEYATAILSALASSYLILRLGL